MMNKEIQMVKMHIQKLSAENTRMQQRRNKLQKRVADEKHLIETLTKITVKLKKEITDTNRVKDTLRNSNVQAEKLRFQTRDNLGALTQESRLFYARAQKEVYQ